MSAGAREWVGRDLASLQVGSSGRRATLASALAGAILAALLLAVLNMQVIRIRYELSGLLSVEARLLEQRSELRARTRRLRDPMRLRQIDRKSVV